MINKYKDIESKINQIVELLEDKKDTQEYKGLYKGIATLLSPLVEKPDILFLGINSGSGAWAEKNPTGTTNITPLRMINEDEYFLSNNDWFKENTARGSWGVGKANEAYEWYQRDKPINNIFPVRMIDLLYNIAEKKYPQAKISYKTPPFWTEDIKSKIMYTNLYPIITDNTNTLRKVHKQLSMESSLKGLWHTSKKRTSIWDVQKYFIENTRELVNLVKPKIIVCMGSQAYNDFTYTNNPKTSKIFETTDNGIPVIGFSRRGNWSSSIPDLSDMICKEICQKKGKK